jgi:Protein of unknown function (DUF3341)
MKGVLAGFTSEQALERAVDRLSAKKLERIETYTPRPRHEETEPTGSPLPLVMFIAGMLGFIGFLLLMTYADVRAYPLDIGGRPKFAWPAFVPIAFELGVLCAMGAGFFGYFWVCRMPQLHDSVDNSDRVKDASRDVWFVAVHSSNTQCLSEASSLLASLNPESLEEFAE